MVAREAARMRRPRGLGNGGCLPQKENRTMTAQKPQYPAESERTELLLDSLSDYAIYLLDQHGFITTWNKGAQKVKGYRPIEIIGQSFSRFFTPEDRAGRVPEAILEAARTAGRYEAEGWRVRKDGSRFWCNAILQVVSDETGNLIGFAHITRDITERVAGQQALLEAERRFRILVDSVLDYAIYMLDPSGIIINWNAGAERLKGYTASEIVGHHFSKFYVRQDRVSGLPARVLETAAREGRYEAEGWRVRKDGSRFWASVVVDAIRNSAGQLEGFAKVTRDITERRTALDAVRDSERQFRLLVAGVTDYAIFMLDPNGIITSWNAGARRIKGYESDEAIGQHFSRFYTDQDRAAGLPARALYTAAQEGRFEAEGWRVRKDGSMFWANVVIDRIRDERGQLVGFAKITRDITERRQMQQALQDAERQRAHAQKMDALGQLTGGVAHDFNNLLMVVSGHLPALAKKAAGDPKALRAVEAIEAVTHRGAALTRQLLTFSRRQSFNPAVFRIADHIAGFGAMLTGSLGSTTHLATMVLPDVWPIKIDANELELAIVNLVLNARDAMPQGGTISVTAENVALERSDTTAELEGDFVALRVSDSGSGIAPDVLPKVFDPFFTTKQTDKGTGLGLSQVYGFVHQSGGTVEIDSTLGKGTTVTLYLPRAEEETSAVSPEANERTDGDGHVLLVEDNPEVASATASMLEELGYRVTAVHDADAALGAIGQHNFDLVVSDIVMPGPMDGVALARTIRDRVPQLPVLLVTGYSQAAPNAANEFILVRKPFELAEFSRTTARMIAQAKQPASSNLVRLRDRVTRS
jgi:PAS domain S-box-containing protein